MTKHMVSKFNWQTTFDDQKLVQDLQGKISDWSHTKLPLSVNRIFNQICPSEQNWKIDSLILDLGVIDYEELEISLSQKFSKLLKEKLEVLIMNSDYESDLIEITNKKQSSLEVLHHYLSNGYTDWQYNASYGSIHDIIKYQLEHNQYHLKVMLNAVGVQKIARKRLAWQTDDQLIKLIIQLIEPYDHKKIISFITELYNIETKSSSQLSINPSSFKKNLWSWTLDYLFTDKVALFSSLVFARSITSQMAKNFNVSHKELIQHISDQLESKKSVKTTYGFEMLTDLRESHIQNALFTSSTIDKNIDYWVLFKNILLKSSVKLSKPSIDKLNQLIHNLSFENEERFQNFIKTIDHKYAIWNKVLMQLNEASIITMSRALMSSNSKEVIVCIDALEMLCTSSKLNINRKELLVMGFQFLNESKGSNFNDEEYLDHCIKEISRKTKLSKEKLFDNLLALGEGFLPKKINTISLDGNFNTLLDNELAEPNSYLLNQKIVSLFKIISSVDHEDSVESRSLNWLKSLKILEKFITVNPKKTFQALVDYSAQSTLPCTISKVLDDFKCLLLIESVRPDVHQLLLELKEIFNEIHNTNDNKSVFRKIRTSLISLAFELLIQDFEQDIIKFAETLIGELLYYSDPYYYSKYKAIYVKFLEHHKLKALNISDVFILKQKHKVIEDIKVYELELPLEYIDIISENKAEFSQLIKSISFAKKRKYSQAFDAEEAIIILDKIIPKGVMKLDAFVKYHIDNLPRKSSNNFFSEYTEQLINAYWKVVLDYNKHDGQEDRITILLDNAAHNLLELLYDSKRIKKSISFVKKRKSSHVSDDKKATIALNKSVPKGIISLKDFVKFYTDKFIKKGSKYFLSEYADHLVDIYWEIVLNYPKHNKGKKDKISALLDNAALNLMESLYDRKRIKKSISQSNTLVVASIPLQSGEKISKAELFRTIKQRLSIKKASATKADKILFSEFLKRSLEISPKQTRQILSRTEMTTQKINLLRNAIPFEQFCGYIVQNSFDSWTHGINSLKIIYQLAQKVDEKHITNTFQKAIWSLAMRIIKSESKLTEVLEDFILKTVQELAQRSDLDTDFVIKELSSNDVELPNILKKILIKQSPNFRVLETSQAKPSKTLQHYVENGKTEALCLTLIIHDEFPHWYDHSYDQLPNQLLKEIIEHCPLTLFNVLKHNIFSSADWFRISQNMNLSELIHAILKLNHGQRLQLENLKIFHDALNKVSIHGINPFEIQHFIFKNVANVWTNESWNKLEAEHILNEIIWEASTKYGVNKDDVIKGFQNRKMHFPMAFQTVFNFILDSKPSYQLKQTTTINKTKESPALRKSLASKIKGGILIRNAGLVLINNYIPKLFEYLNLIDDGTFKSTESQLDAVHFLQYVVTGISMTEESHLSLNKILCGLHPTEPVYDGIDILEHQHTLISEMIQTIINHWPRSGSSSREGFMGNWLVRDGILTEENDKWKLKVEKKAYDFLINQSPFSFSIINYPWMIKPLYVEWAY